MVRDAPRIVVGLRGPAGGVSDVRGQRDSLAWVRSAVEELFVDRVDPEEMEKIEVNTELNPVLHRYYLAGSWGMY